MLYRKIKIGYFFILFTVCSCAQKIFPEKPHTPFSDEVLEHKALGDLGIDEANTGLVVVQVSPNNSQETIIVIAEIAKEEEWSSESNSHIVIIENTTGKITHKFFESSETNGWDSDAIFIDNIAIDALAYKLNASEAAFGVRVHFRNNSQSDPYAYETLSLFTKEKNGLKKILDFYTIYESIGVVNVNMDACYGVFDTSANTLSMGDKKINGYHDILVKKTVSQRGYQEDENGDCNPKDSIVTNENRVLKFNGEAYEEEKEFKEK